MSVYLIEVKEEHTCQGCGKKIAVGERTVKETSPKSGFSATEIHSRYYHESCWRPKKGRS